MNYSTPPTTGPNLKKTMGRESKPWRIPRCIFPTRLMEHVTYACMSFPVDILGKAFSASFRFSRNDANCQGSHRAIIKSLGHPGGSNLGGNSRYSAFFLFRFAIGGEEQGMILEFGWASTNFFKADRQQRYATGTSISSSCFQHCRRMSGWCQLAPCSRSAQASH
jgi:hypothetical protein